MWNYEKVDRTAYRVSNVDSNFGSKISWIKILSSLPAFPTMRFSSLVLVLALTCMQAQSQDPVKQLRGAKEPDLPADSKQETAAESPANDPAEKPANPDDTGVAKEVETETPESQAPEQGETDPAEADVGVPTKEIPAKPSGKDHADPHDTRVPAKEDAEEPLDGEWEVDSMREGPEPMEWEWVPYGYVMEGPPESWEGEEGDWDDDEMEPQEMATSGRDARSFVAWGGRRWGHRGWGGRRWGRGWGRGWGGRGWGRGWGGRRWGRGWGHRGWR